MWAAEEKSARQMGTETLALASVTPVNYGNGWITQLNLGDSTGWRPNNICKRRTQQDSLRRSGQNHKMSTAEMPWCGALGEFWLPLPHLDTSHRDCSCVDFFGISGSIFQNPFQKAFRLTLRICSEIYCRIFSELKKPPPLHNLGGVISTLTTKTYRTNTAFAWDVEGFIAKL